MSKPYQEKVIECTVTYTLEMEGRVYIIENVPARVNVETGEEFFAPETVEHLRATILGGSQSKKRDITKIVLLPIRNLLIWIIILWWILRIKIMITD